MKAVTTLSVPEANHRFGELLRLLPGLLVILGVFAVLAIRSVDSGTPDTPNRVAPKTLGSVGFGTAYPPITVFYLIDSESQIYEVAAYDGEFWGAAMGTGQADVNQTHSVLLARTEEEEAAAAAFIFESIRASKFSPIVSVVDLRNPMPGRPGQN